MDDTTSPKSSRKKVKRDKAGMRPHSGSRKSNDMTASSDVQSNKSLASLPTTECGHVRTAILNLSDKEEEMVTGGMKKLADVVDALARNRDNPEPQQGGDDTAPLPGIADKSQAAKKARMMRHLSESWRGVPEDGLRLIMWRFLRAQRFQTDRAVHAMIAAVEFRKRQNLNRMIIFPSLLPTRGYNEREICDTLDLPFLEDWHVAPGAASASAQFMLSAVSVSGEHNRGALNPAAELENFYQATSNEYLDSVSPRTPLMEGVGNGRGSTRAGVLLGATRALSEPRNDESASYSGFFGGTLSGSDTSHHPETPDLATALSHPTLYATESLIAQTSRDDWAPSATPTGSADANECNAAPRSLDHDYSAPQPPPPRPPAKAVPHHLTHSQSGPSALPTPTEVPRAEPNPAEAPQRNMLLRFADHLNPLRIFHDTAHFFSTQHTNPNACEAPVPSTPRGDPSDGTPSDDTLSDTARVVEEQAAALANGSAVRRNFITGPRTRFNDSLDFHGLLQPIVAVCTHYLPTSFHYWDREGRPVMYLKLRPMHGKKFVRDLFKLTPVSSEPKALALLYHVYMVEVMLQLIWYLNRKHQRDNLIHDALLSAETIGTAASAFLEGNRARAHIEPATSCVVVIDCAGAKLKKLMYKSFLQIVKPFIMLDQKYYPDTLQKLYVVNCNAAVNFSYLTIRSILHESTRRKICFATRHHTLATLSEVIDPDVLPRELGGRCECPGGCIPGYQLPSDSASISSSYSQSESRNLDADDVTETLDLSGTLDSTLRGMRPRLTPTVEQLTVAPRKKVTLTFNVKAREEIFWEFRCKNQRSVQFSVIYLPVSDGGGMFSLSDPARVKDGASHYICPMAGTVILEWKNKYSMAHKINIHAKIYRDGDGHEAHAGRDAVYR